MANTNGSTQELDEKKQQALNNTSSSSTSQNLKNVFSFLVSLLITIILVVIYFIIGSIVLYECKLAQSNIVPSSLDCYPYTNIKPEVQTILTNIFVTNTDQPESVKLSFPYDKTNSKNMILDAFRKYKEQPRSNFFINYIISILEGLFNYNNNALTLFFNLLNGMPEFLIVIFGPIISGLYFVLVPIVGCIIFIYYYFFNMTWFFKYNDNVTSSSGINSIPIWKDVNLLNPGQYGSALFLVFIFFMLFWVMLFTITPTMVVIIFNICLFMTLGYKGEIDGKKISILTIIQEFLKHYKLTLVIIISIIMIFTAFSNLGLLPGIFSILTILLIYFNFIPISVFEPFKANNLSPLSSFDQAEKKCSGTHVKKQRTFFENIENLFDIKKGGGLAMELKNLNKKMKQ